jgi:hypothetical protein
MILLLNSYELITKFLRASYENLVNFLQNSCELLNKFLRASYKIHVNFLQKFL